MSRDRERFDPVAAADHRRLQLLYRSLFVVEPRPISATAFVASLSGGNGAARSGRSLALLWKRTRRRFSATLSIVDAFRSARSHVVVSKAILST